MNPFRFVFPILSKVLGKKGTYETTEVTEKDSVSSKRISVRSETPQDFKPFFRVSWLRPSGLKNRGHRGEEAKSISTL
jgi:hypothetical protein